MGETLLDEKGAPPVSAEKSPPRSAVLMECFEPAIAPDQMVSRLEVVTQHATPALYNAAEHKRIPDFKTTIHR